jgi:hypothetical protein
MTIRSERGQSLIEFAVVLPFLLVIAFGVIEMSSALYDQHVITRLSREGANLISRDSTIQDASAALRTMSVRPVNFDADSKVIFSVIKRGATAGTANFDRLILYQRATFGGGSGNSAIMTAGSASFAGPPNYEASASDTNTNLRVTNLPSGLVSVRGGMLYVVEIYTTHTTLTPLARFGGLVPTRLYSIAYF